MNWKFPWQKKAAGERQRKVNHSDIRAALNAAGFPSVSIWRSGKESWLTTTLDEVLQIGGDNPQGADDCAWAQHDWYSKFRSTGLAVGTCLGDVGGRFGGGHYFGWFVDHRLKIVFIDPTERFTIGGDVIKKLYYLRIN